MPSTVNVTPNRTVLKHYFDPGYSVAQMDLLFELFLFTRGIRFVRAFVTGPIKERSGLEQRQSQPSGPCQWCKRHEGAAPKIDIKQKIAIVVESNTMTAALKNVIFICASTGDQ